MNDDTIKRLRLRIEDGVAACEEMRRLLHGQERPKLRLIQGGAP